MRKTIAALLLIFSQISTTFAAEPPYWDVKYPTHFEAIYWTKEWGIFSGYSGGYFSPSKEMNRAELSKVLVLGSGVEESDVAACAEGASRVFSDVPEGEWYTDYVYCAEAKGWVSGDDGKSTFRPGDPILMGEAFKMLVESQVGTPDDSYQDGAWYTLYVNYLEDYQIARRGTYSYEYTYMGSEASIGFDGEISSKMQRQDIAELLYRLRLVAETDEPYDTIYTLDEMNSLYGTEYEVDGDTLSIADPYFGFRFENVSIEDLEVEVEDLRVFVDSPSAFENGSYTRWYLMYPDPEDYWSMEGYVDFMYVTIQDPDYNPYYGYSSDHDFESDELYYSFNCYVYSAYTVDDLIEQVCVVDETQNVDAEYTNFGAY